MQLTFKNLKELRTLFDMHTDLYATQFRANAKGALAQKVDRNIKPVLIRITDRGTFLSGSSKKEEQLSDIFSKFNYLFTTKEEAVAYYNQLVEGSVSNYRTACDNFLAKYLITNI